MSDQGGFLFYFNSLKLPSELFNQGRDIGQVKDSFSFFVNFGIRGGQKYFEPFHRHLALGSSPRVDTRSQFSLPTSSFRMGLGGEDSKNDVIKKC